MRTAARASVRAAVFFWIAAAAWGVVSCAGPKKLTEQSEKALAQGEVDRSYEKARAALRKAPDNERARQALAAAADRKIQGMRAGVRAVAAASDTLAAARDALAIDAFRRELAEYRVIPAPDEDFDRDAAIIRHSAARALVRQADDAMDAGQPRNAYHELETARDLEPSYPDLADRLRDAYAQALHRIAILPISNQTEARGLNAEFTDLVYDEVTDRVRERNFPFTVILPRSEVFAQIPLVHAEHIDKSEAVAIGRAMDADLVVRGRLYALSTESTSDSWEGTVFRRESARDTTGRSFDRYVEVPIEVTSRERRVTLRYRFEILDVRGGSVVAMHEEPVTSVARVTFTSFHASGDCDDYVLNSPGMRHDDSRAADARERAWKDHCGAWELPQFLERARTGSRRSYETAMRSEFAANTTDRPVFLGELPPVDDMAAVALQGAWEPLVTAIRNLER